MSEIMQEKHQKVLDLLLKYHEENPGNFFFTMRQINRAKRLDEGYWFHGNDGYLAVSFWSGRDWMNKTPRISFTVWESGLTSLILSQKDVDTDIFSSELIKAIQVHTDSDKLYWKNYDEFSLAYLDSLENFIKTDKYEIDRLIKEDNALIPGQWMEYADAFDFIRQSDFTKNLDRIKHYQLKRLSQLPESGYLTGFRIENYGLIKNLVIDLIPTGTKWIFITGENGAGKTTVLRALAIGLCKNLDDDKRIDSDSKFKVSISISGEVPYTVTQEINSTSSFELIKGFAAYGPVRLMTEGTLNDDLVHIKVKEIVNKLTYGLFNSFDILKDLSSHYDLGVKPKYIELEMESFLGNLEEILPNVEYISYDHKEDKLFFYDNEFEVGLNNEPKSFDQLSSGTKSFAALIIDLLLKLRKQQPKILDVAEYRGIVIIDEIDIHFHPKMQKEIIVQLSDTFPKIQFIVSTHSPIPLLGAPKESLIFRVTRNVDEGVIAERVDDKMHLTDLLPNAILTSPVFDMENIVNSNRDSSKQIITEDDFKEIDLSLKLQSRIDDFLTDRKQEELIKLFEERRK